jgi:DNA mismatch repair protein MutH
MSAPTPISPPHSEHELLQRAHALAGLTLSQLAALRAQPLPVDLRNAKGWFGQLIEQQLGATAASLPQPDFQQISVELKTLPINRNGEPKETTYVCSVPLNEDAARCWEESWVCIKLQRVLWLPIESDAQIPIAQRRIGTAILWSPSAQDSVLLKQDWEEIMELISTGHIDKISAQIGTYLQVRPKAANNKALRRGHDENGDMIQTLPRGFYLRTQFTQQILKSHYAY